MSASITIYVEDIATILANYNAMQVQRSVLGPPNYSDALLITAASSAKPSLTGTKEGAYTLQGLTLKLKTDGGSEQVLLFAKADPNAIVAVVEDFNAGITGATGSDSSGKLKIEGDNSGSDGSLELTGGTALSALGFTQGQKDCGEDAHVPLQAGISTYVYVDGGGLSTNYYRIRYFNTATFIFSQWSDWMVTASDAVAAGNLILAKAKLSTQDGKGLYNRGITISPVGQVVKKDDYSLLGPAIRIVTDMAGEAETNLVKGAVVDVVFEGTSIVLRITVPSTGTSFDLLDDSLVAHDPFEIKKANTPYAIRRS